MSVGIGCGEKGTLVHSWWDCRLVWPLWKTVWNFLRKLKIELPFDLEISLLVFLHFEIWKTMSFLITMYMDNLKLAQTLVATSSFCKMLGCVSGNIVKKILFFVLVSFPEKNQPFFMSIYLHSKPWNVCVLFRFTVC